MYQFWRLVKLAARIDPATIDAFSAIDEPTSTIADAFDVLGIRGAVGASTLHPTMQGACIVGQAVTLRNVPLAEMPTVAAQGKSQLDVVTFNDVAGPGDVLVLEGVSDCSNFGGLAALIAKLRGRSGAIIGGGARDIEQTRGFAFPMWLEAVTPQSGRHRVRTVEVNGPVTISGVRVSPGDLVVADSTGVCFIPVARVDEVLALVQSLNAQDVEAEARIRAESTADKHS
jgi:regulator of RNase E activity RraA